MTSNQLLARLQKQDLPPAVLLLGPEAFERRRLKQALSASVPEGAMAEHDLSEVALAEVLDDARALSLFASERLIWVVNAEVAVPKARSDEDSEGDSAGSSAAPLSRPRYWIRPRSSTSSRLADAGTSSARCVV